MAVLTGFLAAVRVALVSILVWGEFVDLSGRCDSSDISDVSDLSDFNDNSDINDISESSDYFSDITREEPFFKWDLQHQFPGYFKTEEEIAEIRQYANKYKKIKAVSMDNEICIKERPCSNAPKFNSSQHAECRLDGQHAKLTHHACCVSFSKLISPTKLKSGEPSMHGKNVKIVQGNRYKQFFETQTCCQAKGCTFCDCSITYYLVTAVVDIQARNPRDRYSLHYVQVPGCCKCLNVQRHHTDLSP